jgi:hypothetical protein
MGARKSEGTPGQEQGALSRFQELVSQEYQTRRRPRKSTFRPGRGSATW